CSFVVPRVKPNTAPLASPSQYGVPNPTKAGTTYTPSVEDTRSAYPSLSVDEGNIRNPSRNHWIADPAIHTLPSKAYSTFPSIPQAKVVNWPFLGWTPSSPVFISLKQGRPYVFFTSRL